MPRIVHFELYAENPQRAVDFYQQVFGWQVQKWNGPQDYWLVTTGPNDQPGINGGILRRQGNMHCVNTIQVDSVDEFVAKIQQHGGQIVVSKMPIPGVGYLAYFKDPEDNIVGVMHPDPSAK